MLERCLCPRKLPPRIAEQQFKHQCTGLNPLYDVLDDQEKARGCSASNSGIAGGMWDRSMHIAEHAQALKSVRCASTCLCAYLAACGTERPGVDLLPT
jgi:aromatic ring hydroxylase